jgi:hypothetical protein
MKGLWVAGAGAVGPLGMGRVRGGGPAPDGVCRRVPDGLPLKEGFQPQTMRWLDNASLWWLNAARQALGQHWPSPQETAQLVGLGWGPTQPAADLLSLVSEAGFSAMTPALFPYSVGNAPAGQASILLGLRGPAITLCAKEAAGLSALVEGSRLVASGAVPACVAGAVDQLEPTLLRVILPLRVSSALPPGEGAYALAIRGGDGPAEGDLARVAGWATLSETCAPHLFPEPSPLIGRLFNRLCDRTGWEASTVDWLGAPCDTPRLRAASERLAAQDTRGGSLRCFQETLGTGGASWAGAAIHAAQDLAEGLASRAVLLALATGGAAWAMALESCRDQ